MKISNHIKWLIPNSISMLNLMLGFLSILSSINGNFPRAALFILLAFFADIFDGKIARRVHSTSKIGAEFDSLADLTSFGVASAVMIYLHSISGVGYGLFISMLIVACAATRLARFNVSHDMRCFKGIPSSAFGLFASTFILSGLVLSVPVIAALFAFFSVMMLGGLEYPTLKKMSRTTATLVLLIAGVSLALTFFNKLFFLVPFTLYAIIGPLLNHWAKL